MPPWGSLCKSAEGRRQQAGAWLIIKVLWPVDQAFKRLWSLVGLYPGPTTTNHCCCCPRVPDCMTTPAIGSNIPCFVLIDSYNLGINRAVISLKSEGILHPECGRLQNPEIAPRNETVVVGTVKLVGIYVRGMIIPGFLRWCRISSIHSIISLKATFKLHPKTCGSQKKKRKQACLVARPFTKMSLPGSKENEEHSLLAIWAIGSLWCF